MKTWAYDFSAKTGGQFPIDLYYTINADQKSVTVTQGPDIYSGSTVEIPSVVTYQGKEYAVTTIGYQAFQQSKISEVIMPNTITEIESYAFNSSDVGNITFSKGLKKIGNSAFNDTQLTSVKLFEGLESIGEQAFQHGAYRKGINTLELPSSLSEIGAYAFASNPIKFLQIPDKIETIKAHTFEKCNLDSVILPKNLRTIENKAFSGCSFQYITFPNTLIEIGASAFSSCDLRSVILPDNVQLVGANAFQSCDQLIDFTFSAGMKEIPNACLSYTSQLVKVTIPEGIEKIGSSVFDHCTHLSRVTFPESVTELGELLFINSGITSITFPKNLKYIPGLIFAECFNLQEITIPEYIDSIGEQAFRSCTNLKKIQLPSNLKNISYYLFANCSSLEELSLPNHIQSIGANAFYGCSGIKTLIIPESVQEIGQYVFEDMSSLQSIEFPKNLKQISQGACMGCTSLKEIKIPESVEQINTSAFNGTALEEVTIPHSVSICSRDIFGNCQYLKALHFQRSTPPAINGMGMNPSIVDEDTECILYVPTGSKATWEAADSEVWGRFKDIVEEEVPDVLYAVQIQYQGPGTVTVNSEKVYSYNQIEIKKGTDAIINFEPIENYVLKSVYCNGKDVTNEVQNKTYTINDIQQNMALYIVFAEKPLTLEIQSAEGGTICIPIEKNNTFTCQITPKNNWIINSVYYNGIDITNELDENGWYTTPSLTYDSYLNISFELQTSITQTKANSIKAHVDVNGNVIIDGIDKGTLLNLINTEGQNIATQYANQSHEIMKLPKKGIYLLKVNNKTIKLCY